MARSFFAAVATLLLFILFAFGATFAFFAYGSPLLRLQIAEHLVRESSSLYFQIALFCSLSAIATLALGIYTFGRRYYHLEMGGASIDLQLIRPIVQEAWGEASMTLKKVSLSPRRRLELIAEVSGDDLELYEKELEVLESKIEGLLARKVGYRHKISLVLFPIGQSR